MKNWWMRPAVRIAAALVLPLLIPAIITQLIWALPGDPASIICPPGVCGNANVLAERWHLNDGPLYFFTHWLSQAMSGDFGNSWRLQQGVPVRELLGTAIPNTLILISLSLIPVVLGSVGAATGIISRKIDATLSIIGLVPALVLSLLAAAVVELNMGMESFSETGQWARLLAGAVVLGLADGAFAGAVTGTRGLFDAERKQRYVSIAILRGESELSNTLPNVAPALAGQLRARLLHLLSGAVIVEVVLRIDGLGDLLWGGTLLQDFGIVLAAATGFAVISSILLLCQAMLEIGIALHIRRTPSLEPRSPSPQNSPLPKVAT